MKFLEVAAFSAVLASQASDAAARHLHKHDSIHALARRHQHHHSHHPLSGFVGREHPVLPPTSPAEGALQSTVSAVEKRSGTCEFPQGQGMVAVSPGSINGGWALPPDQACVAGSYCPYACPPGEMMAQWDPSATSYSYPQSLNGGLFCNEDGEVSKPFEDKPYCVKGAGGIGVKDKTGRGCAFCQTVLPGSESMLIPTFVQDWSEITVPDTDYWCSTAAHFYINPPGVPTKDGCVWGTPDDPNGNWTPYVAGVNKDSTGNTFLKIGWNPIYLDGSARFPIEVPSWGVEIECEGDACNGLPCKIDPNVHGLNEIEGQGSSGTGAGDAAYCVVTVPEGSSANIVVSNADGSSSDGYPAHQPPPSAVPKPTSSSVPTFSPTPTSTSSLTPSSAPSSSSSSSSSSSVRPIYSPHIFRENLTVAATSTATSTQVLSTGAESAVSSTASPISPPEPTDAAGAAGNLQVQAAGFTLAALAALAAIAL